MTEHTEKNRVEGGTLYLVATPIGNLADLSERAEKVLAEVDFIAAEDTRNTGKLLSFRGISRPLVSYHEHNKRGRGEEIAARLAAGESCALVTDAGMPAISDPGEDLVALCAARGIPVTAVPGPSAALTALTLSGLSTARFAFEGFLPTENKARRARLAELAAEPRTLLLHEAPHRLRTTLAELAAAMGEGRRVAVCRELTKRNEEILRTTLGGAAAHYAETEPRGEFVLVIEGNSQKQAPSAGQFDGLSPAAHVAYYEKQGMARMDAIKAAARDRGLSKSELYKQIEQSKAEFTENT